jgi:acetyl-CoA synthetase
MSDDSQALEVHLEEESGISPPKSFVEQANVTSLDSLRELDDNWPEGWEGPASELEWFEEWDQVLDDSNPPFYRWFTGGSLNVCHNCVDRHVEAGRADEEAILWEGEDHEQRSYTYGELRDKVARFAAGLRSLGVGEDDVVTLYMPMIPELPVAMLACARIGAPHSVVFAGFSTEALANRMEDANSQHLVTADGYFRRGDVIDQKEKADQGLELVDHEVESVTVARRGLDALDPEMVEGRDHDWSDVMERGGDGVECVARGAEDMLFLMYTSGTTGQPKGIKHTTGGYLTYVNWTSRVVHDIKPEDLYWCSADIGWITGHSYIVYGPLSLGTSILMYEGAPDHPDRDRLWEMIERYEVDQFNTAPTAIRAFMKWGREHPDGYDLSSLRWLGTVGEPINPRAWKWYYEVIGNGDCPVVDKWWQTETGGNILTTIPAVDDMKPGAAGKPLPGLEAEVVDEDGESVPDGTEEAGLLTLTKPWPGMLRTIYGNDERYKKTYWKRFSNPEDDEWRYFPADGARVDHDGYVTVLGRVDDIMNVAGHNLSTMEIESAVVAVEGVAESAVVGGYHEVKGEAVFAYVIPEEDGPGEDQLYDEILDSVEEKVGPIARPADLYFVEDLPKTRSGKIMRRLLEDIVDENQLGNTSTLQNPEVVESIKQQVQG